MPFTRGLADPRVANRAVSPPKPVVSRISDLSDPQLESGTMFRGMVKEVKRGRLAGWAGREGRDSTSGFRMEPTLTRDCVKFRAAGGAKLPEWIEVIDLKTCADLIHGQVWLGIQIDDSTAAGFRCGEDGLRGQKSDAA
jgi:hypothetical protein